MYFHIPPFLPLERGTLFSCDLPFALIPVVRKTGPWSNKIKQMWKQNTEDAQYKRDTYLCGSPSVGYIHQRNFQFFPFYYPTK